MEPDWGEIWFKALREMGVDLSKKDMVRGIHSAERRVPEGRPLKWTESSDEDDFIRYLQIVLEKGGGKIPERSVLLNTVKNIRQWFSDSSFSLYADVLPSMEALKGRGIVLGVISNMYDSLMPVCRTLKLGHLLDFTLTSGEAGVSKPEPGIFLEALKKSGTTAAETIYVGDHYEMDILGARGAGLKTVLIDRYSRYPSFNECPRISDLSGLINLI
jgi:HAD superfamily hydrolase (TIGR01549 family)